MECRYDVIVIGSGPAGNTAAIYLVRNYLKVALFSGISIGGQLVTTTDVENYPGFVEPISGSVLMTNIMQQTERLGANIIYEQITSVDFDERPFKCVAGDKTYISDFVVIATGVSPRWLFDVPGQDKFKGRGVSVCATCDGSFYKNKEVAVIGGGETAATEALHLATICNKVYLINKTSYFRMSRKNYKKVQETKNIEIIENSIILEIIGDDNELKILNGLKILNLEKKEEFILNISGVFLSIGSNPETEIFKNTKIELDNKGYIVTKHDSARTNIEGVFAVGDVTNKQYKQAIVASGYGAIAGMEIISEIDSIKK
jgi:thioredoxin reductase (NADPH)